MSTITIPCGKLSAALKQIGSVIEQRVTIPILSNILLRAEGASLHLRGTDLDIDIQTVIPLDAPADGSTTLNARRLGEIARAMKDGATLTLAWDDREATVKSGRSRFTMPVMPASDYPDIDIGEAAWRFTMPAAHLARMLAKTEFAPSTSEARYYLQGMYLHVTEAGEMRGVATDGNVLSCCTVEAPEGTAGMPGIIVPIKAMKHLASLAAAHKGDTEIEISFARMAVTLGQTRLVTKLIDGTYPDYERVMPQSNPFRMTIDLAAMRGAIQKAAIMVMDAKTHGGVFDFGTERLRVEAADASAGRIEDEIEAEYDGQPMRTGFKIDYMSKCLSAFDADRVIFALDTPGSPCLITSEAEPGLRVVIMPMQIRGV